MAEVVLTDVIDEAVEPCRGESSGFKEKSEDVVDAREGLANDSLEDDVGVPDPDPESDMFNAARSDAPLSC